MKSLIILIALSMLILSCGGKNTTAKSSNAVPTPSTTPTSTTPPPPPPPPPPINTNETLAIPDNRSQDHYNVLVYGNSHVSGLAKQLTTMINVALPDKPIMTKTASGIKFLDERLNEQASVALLAENDWNHIIFQAQKYSQSGLVDYPTDATQTWVKRAKEQGAMAILFPEHPQRGNLSEGRTVHSLHQSIADKEPACVAPVGLVWDRVIALNPELVLHRSDGNHASATGIFLTALVFYQVITGEPADLIPFIENSSVSAEQQSFLKQIVTEVIAANPAYDF